MLPKEEAELLKKSNFIIFNHCVTTTTMSSPSQDLGQEGTYPSLICQGPLEFLLPSHQEHSPPPIRLLILLIIGKQDQELKALAMPILLYPVGHHKL